MAYTSILQKLSENLKATYENTIFTHAGNVGDSREKEVMAYLKKVMPRKYGFQSGEIFDEEDKNSGQVDIIIYDDLFSTVLTDGTEKIMAPVESTYGIISVKSKMGIRELENAIDGIKKFDSLKRPQADENTAYIMPDFAIGGGNGITFGKTHQQNINCIFAFDTTVATETIVEKVRSANCVDLLVIPGKLCLIGRSRIEYFLKKDDGVPVSNFVMLNDSAVAVFTVFLQVYLGKNRLIARDMQKMITWLAQQGRVIV